MEKENNKIKLLSPKIDIVFHALFRRENNRLTEAMLSDILGQKVKIKSNMDRHIDIKAANAKLGIMDFRVEFEDLTKCNIEVQLKRHEYQKERFVYYLASVYTNQLNKGEDYEQLHRTISIVIIDYELEELRGLEKLNIKWQLRDEYTGKRLLTDKFELVIIEIPKAKRIYNKNGQDKISQWMMFLDNPNSKEVSQIMDKNKDIQQAADELKSVSGDYEIRRIAELKEKYIRDEKAALAYAINTGVKQGIEQGIERGIKQQKIKTAKKLLELNVDMKIIIETTELTREQILELK